MLGPLVDKGCFMDKAKGPWPLHFKHVEKVEPVQVWFTICLRNQWSMWMQDGCKVYMDSYMASNGSCFMVTWTIFQRPPLGGRPNTKLGDHVTMESRNHWFIMLLSCVRKPPPLPSWTGLAFGWGPGHISLHTTLEGPWPHYMILEVFWDNLWTLLLGSHNFMFTALGSWVKWP